MNWLHKTTVGVLIYLTVIPVLFLIYGAFNQQIGEFNFTVKYWLEAYGSVEIFYVIGHSVVFATSSALLSLALGCTAAWITERTNTRLRATIEIANLFGLAVPTIFLAIAWIMLLGPGGGVINQWLLAVFDFSKPPFNIYSLWGMVWVEGLAGASFSYLLMVGVFRAEDRSLQEAAKVSGATNWKTAVTVTLPLTLPGLLAVFIFRFIRGIEAFDVPAVIGLPRRIEVLSTKIYRVVNEEMSYSIANTYALGILALTVVAIYFYQRMLQRDYRFATITGKGFAPTKIDLGAFHWLANSFLIIYLLIVTILPMLITLWAALLPYTRPPSFHALSDLSLRNFESLLRKPLVFRAFENTFILAASAGFICVLLASITSWIVVRSRARARWLLDVLAFLPLTIPGIALGVALVWIYLILPVPVYGTLWILLIGYSTTFLPAAMRFITPGLVQIHRELEESSYVAGATWWRTFKSIIFPLILPSAVGSALYVFMNVFRVLSMAIVVYTPKTVVVPVLIFQQWSESQQGNEIQALLITTAFLLMPFGFLYYWLNRRYGIARRVSM